MIRRQSFPREPLRLARLGLVFGWDEHSRGPQQRGAKLPVRLQVHSSVTAVLARHSSETSTPGAEKHVVGVPPRLVEFARRFRGANRQPVVVELMLPQNLVDVSQERRQPRE